MAVGLLERDDVLSSVEGLVARSAQSAGGAILIEAAAGMGKTAVLDEVRARVGPEGVLAARCVDLERDYPLGVARQLLDPALRRAQPDDRARWLAGAESAPALLRGDAAVAVEEGAAFNALYWVLAAMAADRATLVIVDDVHWSDPESLRWLGYVVRRLEGLRLAVLLAARPSEVAALEAPFSALRGDARVKTVTLEPLSADAVRRIVCDELGAADAAFVAACHEACGGNAFVLGELLSAARERAVAPTAANTARVASLASVGLQRAVLIRLTSLGVDAVAVARATAVLGTDAPVSQVAALAGMPVDSAADVAQALQRVDVLAPGARLSFRHPLLRTAVLADLGEVAIAAAHLRAARMLAGQDAPAEEVAAHLLACGAVGEPWAVEVLIEAARNASARASPRLAARLLERALTEPISAERRALLQAEMGGAMCTAGDPRGIDALLSAARSVADPVQRAGVAVRLGIPMWSGGRVSELPAVLEEARAQLPRVQPELVFQIAAVRAYAAAMGSGELVGEAVAAALALVREAGEDSMRTRLSLALLAAAGLYANLPKREIVALARRALGDAEGHARAVAAGVPLIPAVVAMHLVEDHAASPESFARAETGQRARGALAIGLSTTLAWRAICHMRSGALLEAEADAEVALETAPVETFAQLHNIPITALARVHAERGFPERALAMVDAQLARTASRGGDKAILTLERARVLRALRRPQEAADVALAVGAKLRALDCEGAFMLLWPAVAAEALLECGEGEQAARLAAHAVTLAEDAGAAGPIGCALRVLGLVERDLERLRAAERALAASIMRLEHARCLVDLGATLRRSGQRAAAREPLAAGMELAHRCAANALVARAHEELRAAGARPRSVVRSGVEALTASELRVARLAADGLTNREIAQHLFVTQKTIQTQLRAAYRKLDITGRGDLRAALPI
jgi:DNA-binding CsgD family transcriptional regulator